MEVFCLHNRQASGPIPTDAVNRPGHLILLRYIVLHWEVCQLHRSVPPWGGGYSPVKLDPLYDHPLDGDSIWGGWVVLRVTVPPSHLDPQLLQ